MKNWPALLLAPSLALANLAITYALVTPSCARQGKLALKIVSAVTLLVCAVLTVQAWRNWKGQGGGDADAPRDGARLRPRFVALVAAMAGALSCLVVIAQWIPQWVLSPCAN
jgi:hypothetical protein